MTSSVIHQNMRLMGFIVSQSISWSCDSLSTNSCVVAPTDLAGRCTIAAALAVSRATVYRVLSAGTQIIGPARMKSAIPYYAFAVATDSISNSITSLVGPVKPSMGFHGAGSTRCRPGRRRARVASASANSRRARFAPRQ